MFISVWMTGCLQRDDPSRAITLLRAGRFHPHAGAGPLSLSLDFGLFSRAQGERSTLRAASFRALPNQACAGQSHRAQADRDRPRPTLRAALGPLESDPLVGRAN